MAGKTEQLQIRLTEMVGTLRDGDDHRLTLAELNDLLHGLTPKELAEASSRIDVRGLSPFLQNYVSAMVEQAVHAKGLRPPEWTREVAPLDEPWFATTLPALRL